MTLLSALIRKRETRNAATAIPAIPATHPKEEAGTVARIATVAVANPTEAKTANAATSWGWLLHFADRESLEVYCNPDATHAAILERYPDALAAEPIPERTRRTPTEAEAAELRALAQAIGKAKRWTADEIEWATAGALADPDGALTCFRAMAAEVRKPGIAATLAQTLPPPGCASCTHSRKPGGVTRYCSARTDLLPAYDDGHPLRCLPDDGGADCAKWCARYKSNVKKGKHYGQKCEDAGAYPIQTRPVRQPRRTA